MPRLPEPGPSEAPNFGEPSVPRPAASVLLLRDRTPDRAGAGDPGTAPGGDTGGGIEVLMLKRSAESHFMPNVWVFPGGSLDDDDGEGLDGLRTCAARELEEEAGIGIDLSTELVTFARWVTPEVVKVRFDTWFFLAAAPAGAVAEADGFEMTDSLWISPEAAVKEAANGGMAIVFPTLKQLEALTGAADTSAAVTAAREDPTAGRIVLPRMIGTESDYRIVLPGDPDYPGD